MAYAILRIDKKSTLQAVSASIRHNLCKTAEYKNNPQKVVLIKNESILQHDKKTYTQYFNELTEGQRIRKNAVKGIEIITTFSPEATKNIDVKEFSLKCFEFINKKFNGYIYNCVVHTHESTPHLHFIVCPIDDKGKLNASYYTGNKQKLRELQDEFAKAVECFGLERGQDKELSKARHKSLKEYRRDLDREQAEINDIKQLNKQYEKVFSKYRDKGISR